MVSRLAGWSVSRFAWRREGVFHLVGGEIGNLVPGDGVLPDCVGRRERSEGR